MVRSLYIAGTGMMLQRRRMETITNNIANADTTAYKKEHFLSHSFDEVLVRRIHDHGRYNAYNPEFTDEMTNPINRLWPPVGLMTLGTQVDYLQIDFTMGSLEGTERSTDLALVGDGNFFVVQTDNGERYTRTGHFYIDDEGYLIDSENNRLQGENGDIYVGGLGFVVDSGGQVFDDEGNYSDTIRVVTFEDLTTLRRQGDNLYFATEAPLGEPNPYTIQQGFLEGSNVDIGREMVDMLTMYRAYETNQRMITMVDEINGKAVNEIGRLR